MSSGTSIKPKSWSAKSKNLFLHFLVAVCITLLGCDTEPDPDWRVTLEVKTVGDVSGTIEYKANSEEDVLVVDIPANKENWNTTMTLPPMCAMYIKVKGEINEPGYVKIEAKAEHDEQVDIYVIAEEGDSLVGHNLSDFEITVDEMLP